MNCNAVLSADRKYRYLLTRKWSDRPLLSFGMLNPSTADEFHDDPTIRRCIGFGVNLGYGGIVIWNLFAWRATDPRELLTTKDPVGADNDKHIIDVCKSGVDIIMAWGKLNHRLVSREKRVIQILRSYSPMYLDVTKDGFPRHPLFLKSDLRPKYWDIWPSDKKTVDMPVKSVTL